MDEERGMPAVGTCSLLVIFAVLCLTVFALLGLSAVQAEERLAQASREAVLAYYDADCRAEEIFARLRAGEAPEEATLQGDTYYYTCPISETQDLEVEVRFTGGTWRVLRWQAVSAGRWQAEESWDVWDGGMLS